jgi:cold shock CspA family protein
MTTESVNEAEWVERVEACPTCGANRVIRVKVGTRTMMTGKSTATLKGEIKSVRNRDKGFVFVTGEDGVDRFCHKSSCSKMVNFDGLREGDKVLFDHRDGDKGPRAENLQVL